MEEIKNKRKIRKKKMEKIKNKNFDMQKLLRAKLTYA